MLLRGTGALIPCLLMGRQMGLGDCDDSIFRSKTELKSLEDSVYSVTLFCHCFEA